MERASRDGIVAWYSTRPVLQTLSATAVAHESGEAKFTAGACKAGHPMLLPHCYSRGSSEPPALWLGNN